MNAQNAVFDNPISQHAFRQAAINGKLNMLKNNIQKCIGFIFILASYGSSLYASDDGVKYVFAADYFNKYVWRGQNLNNESVFQPSIAVSRNGFTASIWGNLELTDGLEHAGEFTEFDYGLDYTTTIPEVNWVSFSIGALYYDFPNTSEKPTTELYGGLSFDLPLTPYIKWYRDTQVNNGSYIQLGIGHTVEKLHEFSDKCYCDLQIGSSIGYGSGRYNRVYLNTEGGKLNDWTSYVALPFCSDTWIIKPSINYSTMLNEDIREANKRNDNFWFGISLSSEF
jgi:hypothetical protein